MAADDSELKISRSLLIWDVKVNTDYVLGKGSYGIVYEGSFHGAKVACKKLHTIFFESVSREENIGILTSWKNELNLMSSVLHPNIVQFYGVYNSDDAKSVTLSGNSYIVSELMDKSLRVRNLEKTKLNFKEMIIILSDISAGLCYLHVRPNPIMHRDLASKNVLLTRYGQAKIADLGVAKITSEQRGSHTRHPGTDVYMPVETVVYGDAYDHTIDVYALGVIALELAIGRDPVATQSLKKVGKGFEAVEETERRSKDFADLEKSSNVHVKELVLQCLADAENRISAPTALNILETLQESDHFKSISCSAGPTDKICEEEFMDFKKKSEMQITRLQKEVEEKDDKLTAIIKEQAIDKEHLETLELDNLKLRRTVEEKEDELKSIKIQHKAELEKTKKQHAYILQSKNDEISKLHRQSEPYAGHISRNPPNAPSELKPHSSGTADQRPGFYVPQHSALVMPKSTVSRGPYVSSRAQVHQTVKTRPASAIVTGSASSGGRNYLSQRSHSEDDYLASGTIRHPPALPAEKVKTASGSSMQPSASTIDDVVLELRNFTSQIKRLFDMVKTADSAAVMASCMFNLKDIMNTAQKYIISIPSHLKVPEVQQLQANVEEKFILLKSVNLDQISTSNTDGLSQAARMLHSKLC